MDSNNMNQMDNLRNHIDTRFDSLEGKLDNHLDRISRNEEAINWLKGHVRIVTTVVVTVIGFLLVQLWTYISP
jgi:archaellum component FlaC